jgi:hypothetical protein
MNSKAYQANAKLTLLSATISKHSGEEGVPDQLPKCVACNAECLDEVIDKFDKYQDTPTSRKQAGGKTTGGTTSNQFLCKIG